MENEPLVLTFEYRGHRFTITVADADFNAKQEEAKATGRPYQRGHGYMELSTRLRRYIQKHGERLLIAWGVLDRLIDESEEDRAIRSAPTVGKVARISVGPLFWCYRARAFKQVVHKDDLTLRQYLAKRGPAFVERDELYRMAFRLDTLDIYTECYEVSPGSEAFGTWRVIDMPFAAPTLASFYKDGVWRFDKIYNLDERETEAAIVKLNLLPKKAKIHIDGKVGKDLVTRSGNPKAGKDEATYRRTMFAAARKRGKPKPGGLVR